MTADEIREEYSAAKLQKAFAGSAQEAIALTTSVLQVVVFAEIAAQLAELNDHLHNAEPYSELNDFVREIRGYGLNVNVKSA
jgi:acetylornithine/succinyldiaminopimelate/putrescine aminotransferase